MLISLDCEWNISNTTLLISGLGTGATFLPSLCHPGIQISDTTLMPMMYCKVTLIIHNLLNHNIQKCMQTVTTRKKHPVPSLNIIIDGKALELVSSYKYGPLVISAGLNNRRKMQEGKSKVWSCLLPFHTNVSQEYAAPVWDPHLVKQKEKKKIALKVCTKIM